MKQVPLVAHRGQPLSFPENSLQGYAHVLQAGAKYIETDINFTADEIPILSHDDNLLRLCGQPLELAKLNYADIQPLSAGYPGRFGDQFADYRIATLAELSQLIRAWPEATCFVELKASKTDALANRLSNHLGNRAIDLICQSIDGIASQMVLISFNYAALEYAKKAYDFPIGWVLPKWNQQHQAMAEALAPDYLFADVKILPKNQQQHWPGKWRWATYVVNNSQDYRTYADMDISLIETDRYSELASELTSQLAGEWAGE